MNKPEISEVLEPLHHCLRELLERERKGISQSIVYTDDDVMAATLMYSHILGNRLVSKLTEEKVSLGMSSNTGRHFSTLINEVTLGMSNIDPSRYYQNRQVKK